MAANDSAVTGFCNFNTSNYVNRLLSFYIYPIICILGFLGNGLVILTVALGNKKLSRNDFFLLNLAITNLLFVVCLPFLIYNELSAWPMGKEACKLLQGSYSINLYCGMLLLAWISLEHSMVVVNNSLKKSSKSLKSSFIGCALIWVFAILVSVPTFYYYDLYVPTSDKTNMIESKDKNQTSTSSQHICEFRFENSDSSTRVKLTVSSIQLAVGFLLPLLIIIISYTLIIIHLQREMLSQTVENGLKNKATKRAVCVMMVFVGCHMPYNLILLYQTITMFQEMLCEVEDRWETALSLAQCIAYLQCCLNPVVYGFMGETFRKNFKIFCSLTEKKRYSTVKRLRQSLSSDQCSSRNLSESSDSLETSHL